jgi:hypothetical protein
MSESKTPFNKELIELLLLFSFLVVWMTTHSHAQTTVEPQKNVAGHIAYEQTLKESLKLDLRTY